jgi:hypothetical protein
MDNVERTRSAVERERRYLGILRKREINDPNRRKFRRRRVRIPSDNSNHSEISDLEEAFNNLFVEPNIVNNPPIMAGQAANVNFDANDPVFRGLEPAVQQHLNNLLGQQVGMAQVGLLQQVVMGNRNRAVPNSNIEVPVYDHRKMTSDTYLKMCRTYFTAQGYDPPQFHELLPILFKGEFKLWYDSVAGSINSWDEFREAFKRRYDNDSVQRNRQRLLHTRRQGPNDPTEQFIFEMVNLARQIDPLEDDEVSLKRARDALLPEIGMLVGDCNPWTIDNLLERCSYVHDILNRQSRMKTKKPADIPPLKGLRENTERRDSNRNNSSRGRGNGNFVNSFRGNFNGNRGNGHFRGNGRNDNYGREGHNNGNRGEYHGNRGAHNSFRGNRNERGRGSWNNNNRNGGNKDIKCHKCSKFGHYARECPERKGVVMAMPQTHNLQHDSSLNYVQILHPNPGDSNEIYHQHNPYAQTNTASVPPGFQPREESTACNLNWQGRPGSSDRGYSRK